MKRTLGRKTLGDRRCAECAALKAGGFLWMLCCLSKVATCFWLASQGAFVSQFGLLPCASESQLVNWDQRAAVGVARAGPEALAAIAAA